MTEKLSPDFSFDYLDENYKEIKEDIALAAVKSGRKPEDISFMAVTKTVQPIFINHVIDLGVNLIGENKVQELLSKLDYLKTDLLDMHIIGHLQSNKVRKIIDVVSTIQSVDSISLADEISKQAQKNSLEMKVLLEINIGNEESKTGFTADECAERASEIAEMPGIKLSGLMAVPPICDSETEARKYFERMNTLYHDCADVLKEKAQLNILSMGMSSDYVPAILEGANLVRVGSALFGARRY